MSVANGVPWSVRREISGSCGYAQKVFARAGSLCYHWLPMTHTARQYFWFYGYPKPLAEAWVRLV